VDDTVEKGEVKTLRSSLRYSEKIIAGDLDKEVWRVKVGGVLVATNHYWGEKKLKEWNFLWGRKNIDETPEWGGPDTDSPEIDGRLQVEHLSQCRAKT